MGDDGIRESTSRGAYFFVVTAFGVVSKITVSRGGRWLVSNLVLQFLSFLYIPESRASLLSVYLKSEGKPLLLLLEMEPENVCEPHLHTDFLDRRILNPED